MKWPSELKEKYKVGKQLGEGSSGKVFVVHRLGKNQKRVVKAIKKKGDNGLWRRELEILTLLKHPNIARYFEHFESKRYIFIILEYCRGGDLYAQIQKQVCIGEDKARLWTAQLLSALEYCHGNLLVHRDIKPENILLSKEGKIKLVDFGFAKRMSLNCKTGTLLGSPGYAAIELYAQDNYNPFSADIWSLGMTVGAMVLGCFPIQGADNTDKLVSTFYSVGIRPELYTSTTIKGKPTSKQFQQLIERLLCPDPEQRPALDRIKRDPWLLGYHVDSRLPSRVPLTRENQDAQLLSIVSDMTNIETEKIAKFLERGSKDHVAFAIYHLILERDSDIFQRPPNYTAETRTLSGTEFVTSSASRTYDSPPKLRKRRTAKKIHVSLL